MAGGPFRALASTQRPVPVPETRTSVAMRNAASAPPRPGLVIRVGVTGHRRLDPTTIATLTERVRSVFDVAQSAMERVRDANPELFSGEPDLRVISPLAVGADQIVTREAMARGAAVHSPIPFSREEYAHDFENGDERSEFDHLLSASDVVFELDGERSESGAAYAEVGRMVVEQCDVLIAIWDGESERGTGGTAQIVREAVASGRIVAWIATSEPHQLTILSQADSTVDADGRELRDRLTELLSPPSPDDRHFQFLRERRVRYTLGGFYVTWRELVNGPRWRAPRVRVDAFERAARCEWDKGRSLPAPIHERIDAVLFEPYAWADGLANVYGGLHRTAFILNYLMGAAAVFFALVGLVSSDPSLGRQVAHGTGSDQAGGAWGIWIELVLILSILSLTILGRRRDWHGRWIGYRRLAERLRHLRHLAPLGCAPVSNLAGSDGVEWLARAWERELGMVGARVDERLLESTRSHLADAVIGEQIIYHQTNAQTLHRIHHRLHLTGDALFALTAFCCALHLVGSHSMWLTIGAAVFPALGAALFGIRSQGEFDRIANRSRSIAKDLGEIRHSLIASPPRRSQLVNLAREASMAMSEEISEWHAVFRLKHLTLPA